MRLPTPEQNFPSVFPLREEPEGHVDPSSTLPAKSSPFQASSKPYLHTPIPCNDPTSDCIKLRECSGSPARTSNPVASSTTGRAVSNFIRFSTIPLNTLAPPAFSSPSCSGISYSTPLSFKTTHSTPKDHSALEDVGRIGIIAQNLNQDSVYPLLNSPTETTSPMTNSSCSISLSSTLTDSPTMVDVGSKESIQRDKNSSYRENSQNSSDFASLSNILTDSPCSIMVQVGSMENIQRNTNSSSSENSQNSSDPIYSIPPNTPLENENISASPPENRPNSSDPMYSVPPNSPLENENALETSRILVERQCSSLPNTPFENENISASPPENRPNSSDPMYSVPPNTPLENKNALETSRILDERQCSPNLQIEASPSKNGQNSPNPVFPDVPPNTPFNPFGNSEESLFCSKENSDSDNRTRNIKSLVNLNSGCLSFKENSTYPKSASKENSRNNISFKNENSLKISTFPAKRQCSSQLQTNASSSNISTSPLRESKHKNATGCTNRFVLYLDDQKQSTKNKSFKNRNSGCHRFKENSTYPKSASEENGQNSPHLKNDDSSKISKLPVKRHCSSQLQTDASPSNTSKCPLSKSKRTKNATGSTNRFALHPDDQNQSANNKYFKNRDSSCHRFKGNSTYPKSASEEYGQSSSSLKNENSSKTSKYRDKRQCLTQLQTDASPSNTSKRPLHESKPTENATGYTNRHVLHDNQNQSTKNIKSFKNLNSDYHHLKRNSTYPKSASGESQTNTPLKNGNSSKTSIYTVVRHCSSQLQTNASPSNTSKCPLHQSKHTENATGCTDRIVLYPDRLYPSPEVTPSGHSKATNAILEDKGRNNSMMSLYTETHASDSLTTSNPIKSQPNSNERNILENIVESLRQSYISLSMRNDLPTDASEMSIPSNKPDSKQSANSRNKTRKKSKLISFFTTCFRSSSPRQERQI